MNRKKMVPLSAFFLLAQTLIADTATIVSTEKGKSTTQTVQITETIDTNGLTVATRDGAKFTQVVTSTSGEVNSFETKRPDYELRVQNLGAELEINLKRNGVSSNTRLLKRGPFFGIDFSSALRLFRKNPAKALECWLLTSLDFKEQRLFIISKEEETVLKGQSVIRAKIGLTGIEALFWSAQVWIDAKGRMVKFVGSRGPGTPEESIDISYSP